MNTLAFERGLELNEVQDTKFISCSIERIEGNLKNCWFVNCSLDGAGVTGSLSYCGFLNCSMLGVEAHDLVVSEFAMKGCSLGSSVVRRVFGFDANMQDCSLVNVKTEECEGFPVRKFVGQRGESWYLCDGLVSHPIMQGEVRTVLKRINDNSLSWPKRDLLKIKSILEEES